MQLKRENRLRDFFEEESYQLCTNESFDDMWERGNYDEFEEESPFNVSSIWSAADYEFKLKNNHLITNKGHTKNHMNLKDQCANLGHFYEDMQVIQSPSELNRQGYNSWLGEDRINFIENKQDNSFEQNNGRRDEKDRSQVKYNYGLNDDTLKEMKLMKNRHKFQLDLVSLAALDNQSLTKLWDAF